MVEEFKLFEAEYKFMKIIWDNEPINSTELVKICNDRLGWKKSTTYTVIKKLRDRKIIKNEKATVSSLISINEVRKYESEKIMKNSFNNSLPTFLTAFLDGKKIDSDEVEELKKIIEEYSE